MRTMLTAVALAWFVSATASAQSLTGNYDLRGAYDDGRKTNVKIKVHRVASGKLRVERRGDVAGKAIDWTSSDASPQPGSRTLSVTYSVPGANVLAATYTLSPDDLRLNESIANTTRLAPETSWKKIDAAGGRRLDGLSLGQLAELSVEPLLMDLVLGLTAIGPNTLPHEAKNPRKQIAGVRDLVDLFSFAYPKTSSRDTWKDFRELLDEGYEEMGSFKDLFDMQHLADPAAAVYDMAEVKKLRDPVVDWKKRFVEPARLAAFASYLAHPQPIILTDRKAKDLSPFYWGEAGIEPKGTLDGVQNLARLEKTLLEKAAKDLEKTADLRKLHEEENAVPFHDFRKRLRSATKLAAAFPQIFEKGADPAKTLVFLNEVVTKYGEVNDLIVEHAHAKERDDDSKEKKLEKDIKKAWEDLRDWQESEDAAKAIEKLRKMVR